MRLEGIVRAAIGHPARPPSGSKIRDTMDLIAPKRIRLIRGGLVASRAHHSTDTAHISITEGVAFEAFNLGVSKA